jgi:hypothetical protein
MPGQASTPSQPSAATVSPSLIPVNEPFVTTRNLNPYPHREAIVACLKAPPGLTREGFMERVEEFGF